MSVKDQLIELMSEILEERGYITLHLSQFKKDFTPVSREEAELKAKKIAEILGVEVVENTDDIGGIFTVNKGNRIDISFSYKDVEEKGNVG